MVSTMTKIVSEDSTGSSQRSQLGQLLVRLELARLSMQTLYDLYKDARGEYDSLKSQVLEITKEGV